MNPTELPLRDIHLPDPVGWWPPAPGWWIAAALLLAAIVLGIYWFRRRAAWQRSAVYLAQGELNRLRAAWQEHGDARRLASDVSTWLRRVVISLQPRAKTASLTGDSWWRHLDQLAGQPVFGEQGGALITEAPYRTDSDVNTQALLQLCEKWLALLGDKYRGGQLA